jgi:hypothetical protein
MSDLAFRSPAARKLLRGTRKAKRTNMNMKNNLYIPSNTEAPELNLSYVRERNYNTHKGLNNMVLRGTVARNQALSNNQVKARRNVTIKMAKGEPVTFDMKDAAGMYPNNASRKEAAERSVRDRIMADKARKEQAMKNGKSYIPKPLFTKREQNVLGKQKINDLKNYKASLLMGGKKTRKTRK